MRVLLPLLAAACLAGSDDIRSQTDRYLKEKGCERTLFSDESLGLEFRYWQCPPGSQHVLVKKKESGVQLVLSDPQGHYPVEVNIEVLSKGADERPTAAIRRQVIARLRDPYERAHCLPVKMDGEYYRRSGKLFYDTGPDKEYWERIQSGMASPDDIPPDSCGSWSDGIHYLEFHPQENPRMFIRVDGGQEFVNFEDKSVRFLKTPASAARPSP